MDRDLVRVDGQIYLSLYLVNLFVYPPGRNGWAMGGQTYLPSLTFFFNAKAPGGPFGHPGAYI